jgi:hypothetical protein
MDVVRALQLGLLGGAAVYLFNLARVRFELPSVVNYYINRPIAAEDWGPHRGVTDHDQIVDDAIYHATRQTQPENLTEEKCRNPSYYSDPYAPRSGVEYRD